jgi:VanZ family protein
MQTVLRVVAWLLLIGLVFVTLSPINLRPITPLPTQLERAVALSVVGAAFALAYPKRIALVCFLVLGATIAIEVLQLIAPSRHGRIVDVVVKLIGGSFGIAAGYIFNRLRRRVKYLDR